MKGERACKTKAKERISQTSDVGERDALQGHPFDVPGEVSRAFPNFTCISDNKYVCKKPPDEFLPLKHKCRENRLLAVECGECRPTCRNKRLQTPKKWAKVQVRKTGNGTGWGLFAVGRSVKPGKVIGRYDGEVLSLKMMQQRMAKKKRDDDRYVMKLGKELHVDAEKYGNVTRFINHRCQGANCVVKRKRIYGQEYLGVYAKRRIEIGEEFTFDYGEDFMSNLGFNCRCAAGAMCRQASRRGSPQAPRRVSLKAAYA
tara:strand:+ start:1395 stop:2168 length:774 start_codon:yes stop_codon:yes gene_type:complete